MKWRRSEHKNIHTHTHTQPNRKDTIQHCHCVAGTQPQTGGVETLNINIQISIRNSTDLQKRRTKTQFLVNFLQSYLKIDLE